MALPILARCALALVLAGCTGSRSGPAPAPPTEVGTPPGLNVILLWSAPADLDAYLTDPTSETVYFANNPSRSGGRLLRDTRCADVAAGGVSFVEVANFVAPAAGTYRVGVDFIESCADKKQPVSFRIVVELYGQRQETTGVVRLEEFQPIVVEFEVGTSEGGKLVLLPQDRAKPAVLRTGASRNEGEP